MKINVRFNNKQKKSVYFGSESLTNNWIQDETTFYHLTDLLLDKANIIN